MPTYDFITSFRTYRQVPTLIKSYLFLRCGQDSQYLQAEESEKEEGTWDIEVRSRECDDIMQRILEEWNEALSFSSWANGGRKAPIAPARLDANKDAIPLTSLKGHVREGDCVSPLTTPGDTYVGEDGGRISLTSKR